MEILSASSRAARKETRRFGTNIYCPTAAGKLLSSDYAGCFPSERRADWRDFPPSIRCNKIHTHIHRLSWRWHKAPSECGWYPQAKSQPERHASVRRAWLLQRVITSTQPAVCRCCHSGTHRGANCTSSITCCQSTAHHSTATRRHQEAAPMERPRQEHAVTKLSDIAGKCITEKKRRDPNAL